MDQAREIKDGLFSFFKSAFFQDIGEVNVAPYGAFNVQLQASTTRSNANDETSSHPSSCQPACAVCVSGRVMASQRLQSVTADGRDGSGSASEQTARLLQTVMITHVRYSAQTPTLLCHDSIQAV